MVPVHRHEVAIRSDIERQKKSKCIKLVFKMCRQILNWKNLKSEQKTNLFITITLLLKQMSTVLYYEVQRMTIINIIILVCALDQKCGYRNLTNHFNIEIIMIILL